ncbi:SMC-Scp complex subunit ScpB [Kineococcus sp. G2]|uniref:SMC-Scp complex subunit ScpB n=1 Tax=Kineococcus sp. G2 TaxID=3127484 RepID=UPI00301C0F4B
MSEHVRDAVEDLVEDVPEPPVAGPAHGAADDPGRRVRAAIEAVLMVADEPVGAEALARATGESPDEVDLLLRELAGEYTEDGRGFELRESGGGWRVYSRAEHADVVEAFLLDGQTAKLTQAALETLAIVAYRQPVSRARVSAVRGVSVDGVMRTLLTRGLVAEAGVEATSGATLYRTTEEFLQRMGLERLEDLPPLAPFLPEDVDPDDLEPREVLAAEPGAALAGAVADAVAAPAGEPAGEPAAGAVGEPPAVGDDGPERASAADDAAPAAPAEPEAPAAPDDQQEEPR